MLKQKNELTALEGEASVKSTADDSHDSENVNFSNTLSVQDPNRNVGALCSNEPSCSSIYRMENVMSVYDTDTNVTKHGYRGCTSADVMFDCQQAEVPHEACWPRNSSIPKEDLMLDASTEKMYKNINKQMLKNSTPELNGRLKQTYVRNLKNHTSRQSRLSLPLKSTVHHQKSQRTSPVTREAVDPAKYIAITEGPDINKFRCSRCGNVYKWRKSLNKHWKEKHDKIGYSCSSTAAPFDLDARLYLQNQSSGDRPVSSLRGYNEFVNNPRQTSALLSSPMSIHAQTSTLKPIFSTAFSQSLNNQFQPKPELFPLSLSEEKRMKGFETLPGFGGLQAREKSLDSYQNVPYPSTGGRHLILYNDGRPFLNSHAINSYSWNHASVATCSRFLGQLSQSSDVMNEQTDDFVLDLSQKGKEIGNEIEESDQEFPLDLSSKSTISLDNLQQRNFHNNFLDLISLDGKASSEQTSFDVEQYMFQTNPYQSFSIETLMNERPRFLKNDYVRVDQGFHQGLPDRDRTQSALNNSFVDPTIITTKETKFRPAISPEKVEPSFECNEGIPLDHELHSNFKPGTVSVSVANACSIHSNQLNLEAETPDTRTEIAKFCDSGRKPVGNCADPFFRSKMTKTRSRIEHSTSEASRAVRVGRGHGRKKGTVLVDNSSLPHVCEVCGFRARWPSEMTQHMKNHSDEKPFHCQYCPYRSKWKWDVGKHLKRCGAINSRAYRPNSASASRGRAASTSSGCFLESSSAGKHWSSQEAMRGSAIQDGCSGETGKQNEGLSAECKEAETSGCTKDDFTASNNFMPKLSEATYNGNSSSSKSYKRSKLIFPGHNSVETKHCCRVQEKEKRCSRKTAYNATMKSNLKKRTSTLGRKVIDRTLVSCNGGDGSHHFSSHPSLRREDCFCQDNKHEFGGIAFPGGSLKCNSCDFEAYTITRFQSFQCSRIKRPENMSIISDAKNVWSEAERVTSRTAFWEYLRLKRKVFDDDDKNFEEFRQQSQELIMPRDNLENQRKEEFIEPEIVTQVVDQAEMLDPESNKLNPEESGLCCDFSDINSSVTTTVGGRKHCGKYLNQENPVKEATEGQEEKSLNQISNPECYDLKFNLVTDIRAKSNGLQIPESDTNAPKKSNMLMEVKTCLHEKIKTLDRNKPWLKNRRLSARMKSSFWGNKCMTCSICSLYPLKMTFYHSVHGHSYKQRAYMQHPCGSTKLNRQKRSIICVHRLTENKLLHAEGKNRWGCRYVSRGRNIVSHLKSLCSSSSNSELDHALPFNSKAISCDGIGNVSVFSQCLVCSAGFNK